MEINYKKNNNSILFNKENKIMLDIEKIQNYIPLYEKFFNLNQTNYNNINLNNLYTVYNLSKKISNNKYEGSLINTETEEILNRKIFFKFCPLLDPIKYICNKYDASENILSLPQFNQKNHFKLNDPNNMAYIDGFFTYLTSKLLHTKNFIHGIDFYGSFLSIKNNFLVNIYDEIDYLFNTEEFHSNNNKIFTIENTYHLEMLNYNTRNNKKRLEFKENDASNNDIEFTDLSQLSNLDSIFISNKDAPSLNQETSNIQNDLIFESNINKSSKHTNSSGSSCSSRSSNTKSDNDNSSTNNDESQENTSCSTATEDEVFISINQFPIEIISLEYCENTLDSYIVNNQLKDNEWDSIIFQILVILITYQKCFNMTHNDLHTNNIMYNTTDKKYLYYKINNRHYKIPTFGKIYKIIDYGRAIYRFKNNLMCSDSYHKEGDAATQYNFGPYYDENKPIIEPNYSFDLCRLGCALFDFFIDDIEEVSKIKSPIKKIILNWCIDDKNRNILYKNNGEERYPEFKLYKMIARTVHNHIPLNEIQNTHFEKYLIPKKQINKNAHIMNIDEYETYI